MKNYSKFLALFIIVLALCISERANAQSQQSSQPPQKFSFGLNVGLGNDKYDSYAIGGDMRFLFNISKRLSIPLTIGYTSIREKNRVSRTGVKSKGVSEEYFPIKIGVKGFVMESGVGIYLLLEAGIVATPGIMGGSSLPKVFSPAIGYGWKNRVDLAVKYEDYAGFAGFTGLRLGYWF